MQNGLMGEAGPEAIMPLKKDPLGRLGVMMNGAGGGMSITNIFNVTVQSGAGGSSGAAGGDPKAMGDTIAASLKNMVDEAIRQATRNGGQLNPGISQ